MGALILQMDEAMDFKSYADLFFLYCCGAPRIQFVRKLIVVGQIWDQNLGNFWDMKPALCALLFQRDESMDFKSYTDILLIYCICAPHIWLLKNQSFVDTTPPKMWGPWF